MIDNPLPDDVACLLREYGLECAPAECAHALADRIRWAKRGWQASGSVLASRQRKQCLVAARRLLTHIEKPPRDPEATTRARQTLIEELDGFGAIVKLASEPVGYNANPALCLLRRGDKIDTAMLAGLIAALERIPQGQGSPLPDATDGLIRSAVATWRAVYGPGGYTYSSEYSDERTITGPLPRFLEAVLASAGISDMPSADAWHSRLKNL